MRRQFKINWAHRVQAVLRRSAPRAASAPAAAASLPVTEDWDEAFLRVESYLRAHQIESRVLLSRLTTEIVTAARALQNDHPYEAPVTLAMQVAHARIGHWLMEAHGEGDWADERFRARGRLALILAGFPQRCPEQFLAAEPLPSALRADLAQAKLCPGPELQLTRMPPTALEFPLTEAVEEKWSTFSRSVFFRAATSWLVITGALGIAWYAMH